MLSSPDHTLICPSCSGQNAPDSKFCRHCGATLESASATPAAIPPAATPSAAPVPESVAPVVLSSELEMPDDVLPSMDTAVEDAGEPKEALSSPAEIDARRARQLLERAQGLSERGDTAGAILACRQAIALAPTVPGGHAMLGALLERTGDLTHAVLAWEKAAQMAPESAAPRDLARLRDKMGVQSDAPVFHFDDAELFNDESGAAAPEAPPLAAALAPALDAAPVSTPESGMVPATEIATSTIAASHPATQGETMAPAGVPELVSQAAPATAAATTAATTAPNIAAAMPPFRERRVASVPVRVERRLSPSPSVLPLGAMGTPIGARVQLPAAVPAINPLLLADTAPRPQGMGALWARPSYFGRSLPLVGATILSLGFLSWARGLADARRAPDVAPTVIARVGAPAAPAPGVAPGVAPAANSSNSNLPSLAPVGSPQAQNGGFPISNQRGGAAVAPSTAVANPPAAPAASSANAPARPATRSNAARAPRAADSGRSAARAVPQIPPAPIPSAATRPNAGGASSVLTLPPPNIASPPPAPPATSVLPAGAAAPLNPAGSTGRGYVRITRGQVGGSALPQRPSGRAAEAERAAARGVSSTQAIEGLTAAINANSSDAGFRFQQRATLFLSQGDYSRAADDFQAAISAYNEQINRGDQVASARAGLRAAQSGLNLALKGGR